MDKYSQTEDILPPMNEDDKMWAGLCYPLWFVFGFWILFSRKKREIFLYFHALQGIYFGIASTLSVIMVSAVMYIMLFYRNTEHISEPASKFTKQMGWGFVAIAGLIGFVLFASAWFFLCLWLGNKASSGSYFKIPVIGSIAMDQVNARRVELEQLKLADLGVPVEDQIPPIIPPIRQSRNGFGNQAGAVAKIRPRPDAPIALEPNFDLSAPSPHKAEDYEEYQSYLHMTPPVEKIRSIFSTPPQDEEAGLEEDISPPSSPDEDPAETYQPAAVFGYQQNHLQSDTDTDHETDPEEDLSHLSPLERINLLRKQKEDRMALNAQKNLSSPEIVQRPRVKPDEEPVSRATSFLPPRQHMEIMAKKYDNTGKPAVEAFPRPRETRFMNGGDRNDPHGRNFEEIKMTAPGEMAPDQSEQAGPAKFLSPEVQALLKKRYGSDFDPNASIVEYSNKPVKRSQGAPTGKLIPQEAESTPEAKSAETRFMSRQEQIEHLRRKYKGLQSVQPQSQTAKKDRETRELSDAHARSTPKPRDTKFMNRQEQLELLRKKYRDIQSRMGDTGSLAQKKVKTQPPVTASPPPQEPVSEQARAPQTAFINSQEQLELLRKKYQEISSDAVVPIREKPANKEKISLEERRARVRAILSKVDESRKAGPMKRPVVSDDGNHVSKPFSFKPPGEK